MASGGRLVARTGDIERLKDRIVVPALEPWRRSAEAELWQKERAPATSRADFRMVEQLLLALGR